MKKQVRGMLFGDYVRVVRARKDVDWTRHLAPEDLPYLSELIDDAKWYPMASFERMGLAILAEITGQQLEPVRAFGRASIDGLWAQHPELVVPSDPQESLLRFQVLRRSFFDFPALELIELHGTRAVAHVSYGMSPRAEEAATWQTMGFFDRLLELSGGKDVRVRCLTRSWAGDARTLVEMRWS